VMEVQLVLAWKYVPDRSVACVRAGFCVRLYVKECEFCQNKQEMYGVVLA